MDGVVNVRKTAGPTSHDVVNQVRRIFGQRRVGHAGTLDPMATGVLVVCLGKATRIVEYLVGTEKEYHAVITLGVTTDSQDSTGEILTRRDASGITTEDLRKATESFVGEIEQVPPMISAIKHEGKPLYKLARQGKTVERAARRVTVYSIETGDVRLVDRDDEPTRVVADMMVRCSSGTYIRTLCADIGAALGCGAMMSKLERTRVGKFGIDDAVTVDHLLEAQANGRLEEHISSISDALAELPAVVLDAGGMRRISHGMPVFAPESIAVGTTVRLTSPDNVTVAVGEAMETDGVRLARPHKVFLDAEDS